MKISLNSLKTYFTLPQDLSVDQLIRLIGARLVEVEGVENFADKYRGLKIVKVVTCEKIPDTHLSLCQIDAGDPKHLTQVVCGAHNVRVGMFAVWLPPKSVVPATFGQENFTLSVRKLKGYDSHGMLASKMELAIGDDHTGIVEIDPTSFTPGTDFVQAFDLDDPIIDIENKSLTHRPDAFGLIGFARELAGILGIPFTPPELLSLSLPKTQNTEKIKLSVDHKLCPSYHAAIVELPKDFNQPAKYLSAQDIFLVKAGMRPVSPLVDLTNVLMLQTGQPLHAFDYHKLVALTNNSSVDLTVRAAKSGESLELISGKTVQLDTGDIIIASGDTPVALAGAIGGKNTEVDADTRKIVLESATFSLYHIRKTSMRHGVFTEAVTRFTKGQPPFITVPTLAGILKSLKVKPLAIASTTAKLTQPAKITISVEKINAILGTDYSKEAILATLTNVNIPVKATKNLLEITPPPHRTDLHIPEDIAEEVGRLLGYENIPASLPKVPLSYSLTNRTFALKKRLRDCLSFKLGANEVLTYSFISHKLEEKAGLDINQSYEIANSISPDLQSFRQHLIPSLAEKIYENSRAGYSKFALYELNQTTAKSLGLNQEGVPVMENRLALATFGGYYTAKLYLETLMSHLNLPFILAPTSDQLSTSNTTTFSKLPAFFEPLHSAAIILNGQVIGYLGELHQKFVRKLKLGALVSGFELNQDLLEAALSAKTSHHLPKISRFPSVYRDLTIKTPAHLTYAELLASLNSVNSDQLSLEISPLSCYQPNQTDKDTPPPVNHSLRLKFTDFNKTLSSPEISAIMEEITKNLLALGAQVV